jgi:hypothetical protein
MLPSKSVLAGALGAACALSACAALEGLDGFNECNANCDASIRARDGAGGGSSSGGDATRDGSQDGAENEDSALDDGGPVSDGGAPSGDDAGDAQIPGDASGDASDGGDARPSGPTCTAPADIDGGLLVYYPLEGDTNDRSGNGNNGVATAGTDVMFGQGKVGQGVTILSTGRGIAVSGAATLGSARTLCTWVDATANTTGGGLPVFVVGPTGAADLYDVSTANPNDTCATQVKNTLFIDHWGAGCFSAGVAPAPGSWSLVCFAQSASSTTFFVNGSTSTLPTSTYSAALSAITVGSDRVAGSTTQVVFKGQLDEISIWSAPLSTADMNALYNGGSGCRVR